MKILNAKKIDETKDYTYEQKVALIERFKDHREFKRFYDGYHLWYILSPHDEIDYDVYSLFEILTWRLNTAAR